MNSRWNTILATAALMALVVIAGSVVALLLRPQPLAAQTPTGARQITVVGQGETTGTPDTATVQLGVQTSGESAQQALGENNAQMQALIAKLKELGVAEADIQTSNVSIYPRYNNDGQGINGYDANNSVSVTIRNIRETGALLDQVVQAGANNVGGISFGVDDPSALEQQARDAAIANARQRAEAMAQTVGGGIGQVLSITENIGSAPPVPFAARMEAADTAGSVPIQPGEQTVTAQVQITYELR
jgi:uncharacterized protein